MKTIAELVRTIDPDRVGAIGAVRRMAITLTTKALWQLAGFVIDGQTEVLKAEPFTGIGHAARPPDTGKPEAIVVMVGDAKNPVVIAVRDEKTRAAIAGALLADESMLFNSQAFVHVKANGNIEARTPGGTAKRLATIEDLEQLRDALVAWVPVVNDGGAALKLLLKTLIGETAPFSWPTGTTKLRGE